MESESSFTSSERLGTSTAHVVYFDRVRSTTLALEERVKIDDELREFVRSLDEFREAESQNSLIQIDTGDGLALVFLGDPQLAAGTALALGSYSEAHPKHPLRIGVHSGVVTIRKGLSSQPSVAGPGIDVAAHLMSVASPHIPLFSGSIADLLTPLEKWSNILKDIGTVEIKHARQVRVFCPADRPKLFPSLQNESQDKRAIPEIHSINSSKHSSISNLLGKRWFWVGLAVLSVAIFCIYYFLSRAQWITLYFADFKPPTFKDGHLLGPDDRWHIEGSKIKVVQKSNEAYALFDPGAGALIGIDRDFQIERLRLTYEFFVDGNTFTKLSKTAYYGINVNLNRDGTPHGDQLQIWINHRVVNGEWDWVIEGPMHKRIQGPATFNRWTSVEAEWTPANKVVEYKINGKSVAMIPTSASTDRFVRLIQPYGGLPGLPLMRVRKIHLEYIPSAME